MHTIHKSQVPSKKLTAEASESKQKGICNNFIKQKLEPYYSAEHQLGGKILSVGLGREGGGTEKTASL